MALVVKSAVKSLVSKADMRAGGEFWTEVDKMVERKIKLAIDRAKGNGRKTLRGVDL